jgi:GT2 family glycosyltransferase
MKLGLVTVLYKSENVLEDFLKSIANQTYKQYLLIMIDNSPSDETRHMIKCLNDVYNLPLLHIEMEGNIGVAAGNNVGIKVAFSNSCEDIILLNNDIVFNNNDLFDTLYRLSKTHSIIVPKIYYYKTNTIWYAGGLIRRWFGFVKHIGIDKIDSNSNFNTPHYTKYAPTCFAYIKKDVFCKVGLMDEQYFVYVDDTDFMYRASLQKIYIWFEPSITIEHKVSQSTGGQTSDFSLYYDTRNKIYFSKKYNNIFYFASSFAFICIFTYVLAKKSNRTSATKIVYKAIIDGIKMRK